MYVPNWNLNGGVHPVMYWNAVRMSRYFFNRIRSYYRYSSQSWSRSYGNPVLQLTEIKPVSYFETHSSWLKFNNLKPRASGEYFQENIILWKGSHTWLAAREWKSARELISLKCWIIITDDFTIEVHKMPKGLNIQRHNIILTNKPEKKWSF